MPATPSIVSIHQALRTSAIVQSSMCSIWCICKVITSTLWLHYIFWVKYTVLYIIIINYHAYSVNNDQTPSNVKLSCNVKCLIPNNNDNDKERPVFFHWFVRIRVKSLVNSSLFSSMYFSHSEQVIMCLFSYQF